MYALCNYILYRIKKDEQYNAYQLYVNQHLTIMAAREMKNPQEYATKPNFATYYSSLWGGEQKQQNDTRTGEEIIRDTIKDFGIKIIHKGEEF